MESNPTDQAGVAQQRLTSFRFGRSTHVPMSTDDNKTLQTSSITCMTPDATDTFSPNDIRFSASQSSSSGSRSRPNSHHRRRSSVSTRRESAEMMGISLPIELPSDFDNDHRDIALWALEGKLHSSASDGIMTNYTKVEIPELNNPEIEAMIENAQAPRTKATTPAFGSLAGKRDSFGKLLLSSSNSLKDQLQTLVEEEEEEDEKCEAPGDDTKEAATDVLPSAQTPEAIQTRHRPANLNLRTLTLVQEPTRSFVESLPTPSPSPRVHPLRALTLTPSPLSSQFSSAESPNSSPASRRSLSVTQAPRPLELAQRRQSMSAMNSAKPQRRLSYKSSDSEEAIKSRLSLLTPDATPTSTKGPLFAPMHPSPAPSSSSSSKSGVERPLSPTEQAFLFRSHASLLSRITDLESALAQGQAKLPSGAGVAVSDVEGACRPAFSRPLLESQVPHWLEDLSHSRRTSLMSEVDSVASGPSDEMLRLVKDLKAERDELYHDIEGWRQRTSDLERQIVTLTKRVEVERREAWVVREKVGVLEVEKKRMSNEVERQRRECAKLERALADEKLAKDLLVEERDTLIQAVDAQRTQRAIAEDEVLRLSEQVDHLKARAEQAETDLSHLLATPKVQGSVAGRSRSISSSSTKVDELPIGLSRLKLKTLSEEDEDVPRDVCSHESSLIGSDSESDELDHYEDEDEDDELAFIDDQTSSSFGTLARSNSHLLRMELDGATHVRRGSMDRTWSFPTRPQGTIAQKGPEVDPFLDALDQEPTALPWLDGVEAKRFWSAEQESDDDELPPFILPLQPSPPKPVKIWKEIEAAKLAIVQEDEENDDEMFGLPAISPLASEIKTPKPSSLKLPDSPRFLNVAGNPSEHMVDQMRSELVAEPATPRAATAPKPGSLKATPPKPKPQRTRKSSADLDLLGMRKQAVPILQPPPTPKSKSPARSSAEKVAKPTMLRQPGFASPPVASKSRPSVTSPSLIPRASSSTPPRFVPAAPGNTSAAGGTAPVTPPSKNSVPPVPPMFIPQPKPSLKMPTRAVATQPGTSLRPVRA